MTAILWIPFSPFILPSPVLLSSAAVILLCNHTNHTRRNHTLMKKTNTKQSIQKAPLKCWHAFYETTVSRRDAQGDSWKKILSVLHLSLHICTSYSLFHLKGSFNQKFKFCHHLLTLKYFQTCMNVIVLLNTKGRYSEECGKQSSSGAPLTFIVFFFPTMVSQLCPKTAWLQTFFKISSFVFGRTKKFTQVWNYFRVSKLWQNFHFWVNYPFKPRIHF